MSSVYGTDVSTYVQTDGTMGLDPLFAEIAGERVVIERVARRLETRAGSLPGAPDFGFDLVELLGKRIESATAKARLRARIREQILRDPAVLGVSELELTQVSGSQWSLVVRLQLVTGTVRLVLAVSDVTLEILRADRG